MDVHKSEKKKKNFILPIIYLIISVILFLHAFGLLSFISYAGLESYLGLDDEGRKNLAIFLYIVGPLVVFFITLLITIHFITKNEFFIKLAEHISSWFLRIGRGILSGVLKLLLGIIIGVILSPLIHLTGLIRCVPYEGRCNDVVPTIFIMAGSYFLILTLSHDIDFSKYVRH